ncbi:uncharacterized protein C167.05 [Aspergillus awamori]|uniref:Uncharacterized protein C167.05 n=1 Tax=Aspergillus awamori TaxID=105351 RepID=A0A401KHF0_ASPAW|nr:uncharacterized protein C167.05 [Aspergillus awamori]
MTPLDRPLARPWYEDYSEEEIERDENDEIIIPRHRVLDLYELLGVDEKATQDQIRAAYKKKALKHHPDKAPPSKKEEANTKFQQIAYAYAVLSDERRREIFDRTGSTEEALQEDDGFDWMEFYREQFATAIDVDAIDKLKQEYQGSEEEVNDILQAYELHRGDMDRIYESVMLCNVIDDDERFRAIIDSAIADGRAQEYKKYTEEPVKKRQARLKRALKEAKEAEQLGKEIEENKSKTGRKNQGGRKKKGDPEDVGDLAAMIKQRNLSRLDVLCHQLEEKYDVDSKLNPLEPRRKRRSSPPEEAFKAMAARGEKKKKQKRTKGKPAHMSLETALEEERRELLEEMGEAPSTSRRRSLLDISPSPGFLPPRHGSIAGIGVGVTPPSSVRHHSLYSSSHSPLPSPPRRSSATATTTATTFNPSPATATTAPPTPRATTSSVAPPLPSAQRKGSVQSDGSVSPTRSTDLASGDKEKPGDNNSNGTSNQQQNKPEHKSGPSIRWDLSTNMPPSVANRNAARRTAQPQEKPSNRLPSMAAVMSGLDLKVGFPSFVRGRDSSRSNATRGTSLDSRVSSLRPARSSSPKRRWLNPNTRGPVADPVKQSVVTTKKEIIPMAPAAKEPTNSDSRPGSPEPEAKSSAPGEERLEKDRFDSENNPIETSDEDADESTSSDEEAVHEDDSDVKRGRKKAVEQEVPVNTGPKPLTTTKTAPEFRPNPDTAEKPELIHSAKQGPVLKKPDVHPRTSFDSASATNTPFGSEDEAELSDIKRAQKLGIQMSSIDSTVQHRSIRTIIRGDYAEAQEETESSRRRQRKYLVATDLSEESVYALEWTIGTILRDGDTMFAVCAMHDETATPASVQIGDGAKAIQDAAAVVGSQTAETAEKAQNDSNSHLPRALFGRLGTDSKPSSVDARGMSKAESERVHAVEVISQTCVRLLRKTLLQVRVAVEAIHCKSPKHMITEAIDGLDPTLVIVGARGRSALKGVLLGSFSNYLVMHSSVPVMVARKKLKKQTKNKKTNVRLSNNLTTPKKLALAKVD